MAINIPKMEYELFVRLKRVIDKYKEHFGEEPTIYKDIMAMFYSEINEYTGIRMEDQDDIQLRKIAKRWSVVKLGTKEGVEIGKEFFDTTMTNLYKYIDKRDFWLIRYMIKSGFLSEREPYDCEICEGVELNRKHLTNKCIYMDEERRKLREILRVGDGDEDLEEKIIKSYYNMDKCEPKRAREKLMGIKNFVSQLYIKRGKLKEILESEGKKINWKMKKGIGAKKLYETKNEMLADEKAEEKAKEKAEEKVEEKNKKKNRKKAMKKTRNTGKQANLKKPENMIQNAFGKDI